MLLHVIRAFIIFTHFDVFISRLATRDSLFNKHHEYVDECVVDRNRVGGSVPHL